ncbi:MAG: ribonuclease P protein component [Chloroflexota bacterium]
MKHRFRLIRSSDFKRVRRSGKSYAHPLVVLYVHVSERTGTRLGVAAGRTIGNAVQRNRAKRLLREAARDLVRRLAPGFDLLLIARSPLPESTFSQTRDALAQLFGRAGLFLPGNDG